MSHRCYAHIFAAAQFPPSGEYNIVNVGPNCENLVWDGSQAPVSMYDKIELLDVYAHVHTTSHSYTRKHTCMDLTGRSISLVNWIDGRLGYCL